VDLRLLPLDGNFYLGPGSGEALNEHIVGARWPEADKRLEMLEGAVQVIRTLWQGGAQHFEQASELVTEEMLAAEVPCGPDVDRHVEAIREYAEAGFDELYINQIGPEQDAFFEAYREQVLPRVR
jgi:hypothetical protein